MFLNERVIIITLSKDAYKGKVAIFNLTISIKVITRNNRLQNAYRDK